MKLLFLGLCLASVLGKPAHHVASSLRQGLEQETPGRRPPGGPGPMSAELLKDLNLSADQQERVDAIFKNQQQEMEDLRSSTGNDHDHDKIMSSMRKLESQADAQLKATLTSEQYAKYQAKKKDRPRPPKDGHAPPRDSQ
ncbi:hypothetical protein [Hymenobacter crusticola]|uniref:Periplasmic heavy metal sensor n=1 Tax=Hymenobacter crusticola TaxID=1770526 RepID=A0A243WGL4_9BACT|nr:hypothetical protein [Hymenobacter crusticola]OUJ74091.1 hypothetical protein BXP70_10130 [Hymenobacter crusticola]